MTTPRTRTPWSRLVAATVAGLIMGAGSGALLNSRQPDGVDVTSSVPAPVSGEQGQP